MLLFAEHILLWLPCTRERYQLAGSSAADKYNTAINAIEEQVRAFSDPDNRYSAVSELEFPGSLHCTYLAPTLQIGARCGAQNCITLRNLPPSQRNSQKRYANDCGTRISASVSKACNGSKWSADEPSELSSSVRALASSLLPEHWPMRTTHCELPVLRSQYTLVPRAERCPIGDNALGGVCDPNGFCYDVYEEAEWFADLEVRRCC